MAAMQVASRWSSLNLISPPPHGEYTDQQNLHPSMHLESLLASSFGEFLEKLMAAISKNALPNLTVMSLTGPATVLCLVQPACSHIYHSLNTIKIQLPKKMECFSPQVHAYGTDPVYDSSNVACSAACSAPQLSTCLKLLYSGCTPSRTTPSLSTDRSSFVQLWSSR